MRPLRQLLPLALVAAFLLPGCVESSFETIPSAGWKAGNSFSYVQAGNFTYEVRAEQDGEVLEQESGSEEIPAGESWAFRIINTQAKDGADPLYVAVAGGKDLLGQGLVRIDGPSSATGVGLSRVGIKQNAYTEDGMDLIAFRQRNLEAVRLELAGHTLGTTALENGFDAIRFPLVYGDSWTTTIDGGELGDEAAGQLVIQSVVKGMSKVDSPYGRIDAVRIHHEMELPALGELSEADLQELEKAGVTIDAYDIEFTMTADVFWAPSLHALLLEVVRFHVAFDIGVTQEEHSARATFSMDGDFTFGLTAVDLAQGPETPLDATVVDNVQPPSPITEAEQLAPVGNDTSPGHLEARVSTSKVNAAQAPQVTFQADAGGALGPVHWVLYDGAGVIVLQGDGTSFDWTADRPGAYQASFTAYDFATKATLTANVPLEADYVVDGEAVTCPPVSLGAQQCAPRAVPVGAGMTKLTLMVERAPILVEEGLGTLIVSQGGTDIAQATLRGNVASIDMPLDIVADGDLSMRYESTVGVQDQIAFSVNGAYEGQPIRLAPEAQDFLRAKLDLFRGLA